jgi:transcriptional regulator with XRE-family HTH domain
MTDTIQRKQYKRLVVKLKDSRLELGMTQVEVAEKLKKPQSYISKVESGEQRIDVIELKSFANLYKKQLSYFV